MSQPVSPASASPEQALAQMVQGKIISQSIFVAADLDIAMLLKDGPRAAADLAAASGSNEDGLYRLLRALSAIGVFEELPGRRFKNSPISEMLRSDVPSSMRAFVRWVGVATEWSAWGQLGHSVRTGKPSFDEVHGMQVFEYLGKNDAVGKIFNEAMTELSTSEGRAVASAYDFSGIKTLVDVGGGHGELLTQILDKYPSIRGIVYDLPEVIETSRDALRTDRHGEQIDLVEGSFFEKVPPDADAYIMKHILHDWDDEHCERILTNCREAVAKGGRILVVELVVTDDAASAESKVMDLEMLVMTTGGRERTREEFEALFKRAGLKLAGVTRTESAVSVLEARLA